MADRLSEERLEALEIDLLAVGADTPVFGISGTKPRQAHSASEYLSLIAEVRRGREALDQLTERVAYWRLDAAARLDHLLSLRTSGLLGEATQVEVSLIMPTLAALRDDDAEEWWPLCELCSKPLRVGQPTRYYGGELGEVHAACMDDPDVPVHPHQHIIDEAAVIARAEALINRDDD